MTGGPFSLTLTVPTDGFVVTEGDTVLGGLKGPVAHHHFCPHCMSWAFTTAEGMDGFVNVRTALLEKPSAFPPMIETWTSEKIAWAETPAIKSYATQPGLEEYRGLIAQYRASRRS